MLDIVVVKFSNSPRRRARRQGLKPWSWWAEETESIRLRTRGDKERTKWPAPLFASFAKKFELEVHRSGPRARPGQLHQQQSSEGAQRQTCATWGRANGEL